MSEFCLECWNKINKTEYGKEKYIISKDLDFCEGCGKWKPVIVMERHSYYMHKFKYLFLPFKLIFFVIRFIWNLLKLPYMLFKYKNSNNR